MVLIIILAGMSTASSDHDTERLIAARLGAGGSRYTSARRLVARALAQSTGPQSATELLSSLEGAVPLSSLYRTLGVLEEAGVLAREHGSDGIARYELAEWLAGHHHHLVCTGCGEVLDIAIDPDTETKIASLIDHIAGSADYAVSGHRIDIEGRCTTCVET